jgi:hypothetical protein
MHRLSWTAALLAVVVLLASCGTVPQAGHHGHSGAVTVSPLRAGERFATLTMAEPYKPAGPNGGTDDYRCFLIDPKLTGNTFLTGAQFQPQNTEIVHHAIFFRLDPQQAAKARKLDDQVPGQGWTCFGDAGVEDASWVAQWAPGTHETLLDPKYGYPLPPGSSLVMQVHYNLLNVEGDPGADRSAIRLRLTDRVLEPLQTVLFPAPIELPCTPQESGPLCDRSAAVADVGRRFGHDVQSQSADLRKFCGPVKPGPTQHCDLPVREPAVIHALFGHMHLLGRSVKIELNPGTPGARTLLDVPTYNFDDQSLHLLPQPVKVQPGDTVRVTCTHDATLRAKLPQLRKLPPRYVVWGDGTSDEMCLGVAVMSAT